MAKMKHMSIVYESKSGYEYIVEIHQRKKSDNIREFTWAVIDGMDSSPLDSGVAVTYSGAINRAKAFIDEHCEDTLEED